jgi:hypothetical protein
VDQDQARSEDGDVREKRAGYARVGGVKGGQRSKVNGDCVVVSAEGLVEERGRNVQLKFGPGNAWMMARPSRKSRDETHPSATMYLYYHGQWQRLQTVGSDL